MLDVRIALALLIAPAALAEPNEFLRRAHEEIYEGRPWCAVELLAEVLRPVNSPDDVQAQQLLNRIEPSALPPIQVSLIQRLPGPVRFLRNPP